MLLIGLHYNHEETYYVCHIQIYVCHQNDMKNKMALKMCKHFEFLKYVCWRYMPTWQQPWGNDCQPKDGCQKDVWEAILLKHTLGVDVSRSLHTRSLILLLTFSVGLAFCFLSWFSVFFPPQTNSSFPNKIMQFSLLSYCKINVLFTVKF